jgi:hypothetical protein
MADIIGIIGIVLGGAGILATAIVGIKIFQKQQKADEKTNEFIKEQHEIILKEDERKKTIKRFYVSRIHSDYKLFEKHYNDLKQKIYNYLKNSPDEKSWLELKGLIDGRFFGQVDSFVTITDDIKQIVPILNNPRLMDKYSLILDFAGQMKGYAKELSENKHYDNTEIIKIEKEMDDLTGRLKEFWSLLLEEVDNLVYESGKGIVKITTNL